MRPDQEAETRPHMATKPQDGLPFAKTGVFVCVWFFCWYIALHALVAAGYDRTDILDIFVGIHLSLVILVLSHIAWVWIRWREADCHGGKVRWKKSGRTITVVMIRPNGDIAAKGKYLVEPGMNIDPNTCRIYQNELHSDIGFKNQNEGHFKEFRKKKDLSGS